MQCNLRRSEAAYELLPQISTEYGADLLLISEQYRDRRTPTWYANASGTSAIWVRGGSAARVQGTGRGDDFVWVTIGKVTYVSVYLSPNKRGQAFLQMVERLEDALRLLNGNLVIAGDFNSRAIEWGMPETNTKGRLLLEMAARLELTVANVGRTMTYRRPGFGSSIPDVTFVTDRLATCVKRWRVIEDFTASDHQPIVFHMEHQTEKTSRGAEQPPRWNVRKLNADRFTELLTTSPAPSESIPSDLTGRERTEAIVDSTMRLITQLCDKTMPKRHKRQNRREEYWWTDEIASLRRACIMWQRRSSRAKARRKPNAAELAAELRTAKKTLTKAIKSSKFKCNRQLCNEVDKDPWGLGYKIVTRKLGARAPPELKDRTTMDAIVDGLFPNHPIREEPVDLRAQAVPEFTQEELVRASSCLKAGKAPGPDGIPGEILRRVACNRPQILLDMFNDCLRTGTFSKRWKTARLVLLYKGKGDPDEPTSNRPLSLLDTAGKLLEQLLRPRLTDAIAEAGGLSDHQ